MDTESIEQAGPHEGHVFAIAVVEVAGDIGSVAVLYVARLVTEAVPDRFALAVLIPGAPDLKGGGGVPHWKSFGN